MVADILPTGYEVGVLNGHVAPGDVVAIVGAGPIGLAAIIGRAALQPEPRRRDRSRPTAGSKPRSSSAPTSSSTPRVEDPLEVVRGLTDGLGADVAIEAVGTPEAFELTVALARPGGHIANIGVHGKPATLHLEELWIKDVTITTGLVDTFSTPTFLRLLAGHQLDASRFVDAPLRPDSSWRPTTCSRGPARPAR